MADKEKMQEYLNKVLAGKGEFNFVLNEMAEFNEKYPDAQGTFAHIVLGDTNLSDENIMSCLRRAYRWETEAVAEDYLADCYNPAIHETGYDALIELRDATARFLRFLLSLPESERLEAQKECNGEGV